MRHCRKRRFFRIVGFMLLSVASLGMVTSCKNHSPEARIEQISEKIADKLDFNNDQKVLLEGITNDLKKDFAEEKALRKAHFEEIEKMVTSDILDKARIKELILARQARMDARLNNYLDKIAALHKSLTPEQKTELKEKLEKFKGHWE